MPQLQQIISRIQSGELTRENDRVGQGGFSDFSTMLLDGNFYYHNSVGDEITVGVQDSVQQEIFDTLWDLYETMAPKETGNISDGYHTFNELYEYRKLYNALIFNEWAKNNMYQVHKSKRHSDGEECFGGGWFIVVAELPSGQISNHYELKDWDLFICDERELPNTFDGHTPNDVKDRIIKLLMQPKEIKKEYRWNKITGELLGTFYCDKPMGDNETNVKPPKGL